MSSNYNIDTVEIPTMLLKDMRISIKARVLYALLTILEDRQPVRGWELCTLMGIHEQSRRKYMKELVHFGWVKYVPLTNSFGDCIMGYEVVKDYPIPYNNE